MKIYGLEHKIGDKVWAINTEARPIQIKPACAHCGNGPQTQYRNVYEAKQYCIVSINIAWESNGKFVKYYCPGRAFSDGEVDGLKIDDPLNRAYKTKADAERAIKKMNKVKYK